MKKSDIVMLTTAGIGLTTGIAVWLAFPGTPWYIYLGMGIGVLIAIPKAVENVARQKTAKQILDDDAA